jgi:hypothetical protein
MEQEYTKDYFWEIYKQLPEDLKDALFSDKNNEVVTHICTQAGLNEEQLAIVAKFTGRVIMGLLPLNEFPITLELELNISQDLANQINRQIYISIFKHLRVSLNKINDYNSKYSDSFTSNSDGVLEKKEREEQRLKPKIPPQIVKPKPEIPQSNTVPIFPSPEKPIPVIIKEPIASDFPIKTDPPSPEKPIEMPENPIFEEPSNSAPSRDAFKKSLESLPKEEVPKPISSPVAPTIDPTPEKIKDTSGDPYKEMPL